MASGREPRPQFRPTDAREGLARWTSNQNIDLIVDWACDHERFENRFGIVADDVACHVVLWLVATVAVRTEVQAVGGRSVRIDFDRGNGDEPSAQKPKGNTAASSEQVHRTYVAPRPNLLQLLGKNTHVRRVCCR